MTDARTTLAPPCVHEDAACLRAALARTFGTLGLRDGERLAARLAGDLQAVLAAAADSELLRDARVDRLTGLANGAALEARLLDPALSEVALLFVDFDGLREANALLGYAAGGDALIRAVGGALAALLAPGEEAYRSHAAGDEFAIVAPGIDAAAAAARATEVERALDRLDVGRELRGVYRGASVGAAVRRPGETAAAVRDRAAAAMRARKRARRRGA